MSDVKLFRLTSNSAQELASAPVRLEKTLQVLIEKHLETFLLVRLVASEYSTGKTHAGRIDTLGLDENFCPVIIEYKRSSNANVINQGLFYLDWLMDHKAEFQLLVQKRFDQDVASQIDWTAPRLLCIAEDFTRYDIHAIQQINRNIELVRYAFFGEDLLMLDLVNVVLARPTDEDDSGEGGDRQPSKYTTQEECQRKASPELKELYEALRDYMTELDDSIQEHFLKYYIAYRKIRNFATVMLQTQKNSLLVHLSLNPTEIELESGFARDVRNIGHYGTGDLELTIRDLDDLEKAKPLIQKSFEEN
jgi:predicted transport protein